MHKPGALWCMEVTNVGLSSNRRYMAVCEVKKSDYKPADETHYDAVLTCCQPLTEEHFHLLVSVKNEETRLKLFRTRGVLDWAARLRVGDYVHVMINSPTEKMASGVIRHVGKFYQDDNGRMFGIELDPSFHGQGCSDGFFKKLMYFECEEDCGVFVSVAKLVPPVTQSSSVESTLRGDTSLRSFDQSEDYAGGLSRQSSTPVVGAAASYPVAMPYLVDPSDEPLIRECQLTVGEKIVWMSDQGSEFGDVMWIGFLPDHVGPRTRDKLTVGVEFRNKIGSGTGRYKSYKLFEARRDHASLVPIVGLMKASDFGFDPEIDDVGSSCGGLSHSEFAHMMTPHQSSSNRNTNEFADTTFLRDFGSSSGSQQTPQPDVIRSSMTTTSLTGNVTTASDFQPPASAASLRSNVRRQYSPDQRSLAFADSEKKRLPSVPSTQQLKGHVMPPSIADVDWLCGANRGIQRAESSVWCALECVLLTMFAFNADFDEYLFNSGTSGANGSLISGVLSVLVEHIVNPIRRSPYVSGDKIKRFSELLTMIPVSKSASSSSASEKPAWIENPSFLVYHILRNIVGVPKLFSTVNERDLSDGGCIYTVDDVATPYPFPNLQNLMECAVVRDPSRRIVGIPKSMFIVSINSNLPTNSVAGAKKFPALVLDLAGLLDNIGAECLLCGTDTGTDGGVQCGDCFMSESSQKKTDVFQLAHFTYCPACFELHCRRFDRQKHVGHKMNSTIQMGSAISVHDSRTKFDLCAIVSFIGSHFVVFFKAGGGSSAEWLMFDAMAARSLDSSVTFVPEIRRCPEIAEWLSNVQRARLADKLPDIIHQITVGLRLCFYRPQS